MRVISMVLDDREFARVEEGGIFKNIIEPVGGELLPSNLFQQLYEDCFYGIPNSSTFDERFELARANNYFCWRKPALQLVARTLKEEMPAVEDEIRTSIKSVYGMLREVLALYEKTKCYNLVPAGEKEQDIQKYMGNKLLEVRKGNQQIIFQ